MLRPAMRRKLLAPRGRWEDPGRVPMSGRPTGPQGPLYQDPTRWLIANEAGWGVPHGPDGMLALLAFGYLTVGIRTWIAAHRWSRRP